MKKVSPGAKPVSEPARNFLSYVGAKHYAKALKQLEKWKNRLYASIPEKLKIGRGITWVLKKMAEEIFRSSNTAMAEKTALFIADRLDSENELLGVSIFLMGLAGRENPENIFEYFLKAADFAGWELKEFAAIAFRPAIRNFPDKTKPFLNQCSLSANPNLRRFASETLRPVAESRWLYNKTEYSLAILRNLFREPHEFPRTSVGNNLSELSKKHPGLIFGIVRELVRNENKNSYWIAYRACRNLVKIFPEKVMDILKTEEYHYKDRNFYRK